ncbi:DUF4920 domain-containing protein [Bizionia gelidisalsuginis]|uniref:DUF4920 domain-containing protein n=2 Tax=Bizionia TaxID=283785 RepID=A0A8H2LFC4_9FLAO|nr:MULTISPECIES: DUF4920 domain-containing protein [Bizionia]TYB80288.1 DUF4920 domain-containing protein [Bizionia saleffrena]TYC17130.1 DUF4920 domain-containing protein [Bizionia gelidisalsuginis]
MKNYLLIPVLAIALVSCKEENKATDAAVVETVTEMVIPENVTKGDYESFGKEIVADDAIAASSMAEHYKGMKIGDSIDSKIIAKIDEVCQAKGCWMKLDLGDEEQAMVKFKDYAFFMPKDSKGKEVIINGKAYVKEVSVEEQRHYAEDAGESPEAIAAITEPKRTYSFEADGVLLKK